MSSKITICDCNLEYNHNDMKECQNPYTINVYYHELDRLYKENPNQCLNSETFNHGWKGTCCGSCPIVVGTIYDQLTQKEGPMKQYLDEKKVGPTFQTILPLVKLLLQHRGLFSSPENVSMIHHVINKLSNGSKSNTIDKLLHQQANQMNIKLTQ
jgi:hypothetical protein